MSRIFTGLGVFCPMDDVLIFGSDKVEHDTRLLAAVTQYRVTLNTKSVNFARPQSSFLTLSARDAYIYARARPSLPRGMHIYMLSLPRLRVRVFISLATSHRLSTGRLDFRHVREMFRSQSLFQRQHGYASAALPLPQTTLRI